MTYMTITSADTLEILATNIVHRESEVHNYQINIDNYTMMLAALPTGEWPSNLVEYKTTAVESIPSTVDFATVQQISDYQYRDRLNFLMRTEHIEQNKAQRVLNALKTQIPADQLDSLVVAAKAKIANTTP
jgi:hypothetical protein